jgi:hypothetical protein
MRKYRRKYFSGATQAEIFFSRFILDARLIFSEGGATQQHARMQGSASSTPTRGGGPPPLTTTSSTHSTPTRGTGAGAGAGAGGGHASSPLLTSGSGSFALHRRNADERGGGSASRLPLKEKFVDLYEAFFNVRPPLPPFNSPHAFPLYISRSRPRSGPRPPARCGAWVSARLML